MKEKIKKILLLTLLSFVFLLPFIVEARSGCCSHHGGVCGCRCCDGTPLSATCAPYYPQCSAPKSSPQQPSTQQPATSQNTENPQTSGSIDSKLLAEIPKENSKESNWWWIIGIGLGGFFIYKVINRRK